MVLVAELLTSVSEFSYVTDQKSLAILNMVMEKGKCQLDHRTREEKVLHSVKEERIILGTIKKSKG